MTENVRPLKGSNRHPVDELGEVREAKKALEEREKALKEKVAAMMGAADSLGGEEFIARQRVSERRGSLDEKALKERFGDEAVETCRKPPTTTYTIETRRRAEAAA